MAEKASVDISIVKVQHAFDKKYESALPSKMRAVMEKMIAFSSNMQKPTNDKAKRFTVGATCSQVLPIALSAPQFCVLLVIAVPVRYVFNCRAQRVFHVGWHAITVQPDSRWASSRVLADEARVVAERN